MTRVFSFLPFGRAGRVQERGSTLSRVSRTCFIGCFLTLLASLGCGAAAEPETGSLSVNLTDAPGPYERVDVDITSIEVHRSADPESVWSSLSSGSSRVNLLTLRNGAELPFGAAQVAAGHYDAFRVRVSGASVTVSGVTTVLPLDRTVTVIPYAFQVATYDDTQVLLDFDALGSVKDQAGRLSFSPEVSVKREQRR